MEEGLGDQSRNPSRERWKKESFQLFLFFLSLPTQNETLLAAPFPLVPPMGGLRSQVRSGLSGWGTGCDDRRRERQEWRKIFKA